LLAAVAFVLLVGAARAQSAPSPAPDAKPEALPPPTGEVLFERHTEPDVAAEKQAAAAEPGTAVEVSDAERGALRITAYDLDVRVKPAASGLAVRARLTVRNAGATPLKRVVLHVSSTLRWESATLLPGH